jgi:predicted Zn-dependent peptidase
MSEIVRHTFNNGFRLIYENSDNGSDIAAIKVFCDIGSIHELDKFRGAAHFIEHMCFKGTTKIPNSKDVVLNFEKYGSNVNAFTDRRYTCYFVDVHKDHLETSIHTWADMLLNSIFDKHEYEKEHEVVKEELLQAESDYSSICFEAADQQLYAGSPYEHDVDNIKYHIGKDSLDLKTVFTMYKKYYIQSRLILSICCPNSFKSVKDAVEKSDFIKMPSHILAFPPLILALTPQTNPVYKFNTKKSIITTFICFGFRTCSVHNEDRYALKVLKNILGGKMSSRLFTILREENGLTYSSTVYTDYYEHSGDFKIYAECDTEKVFKNGNKPGVLPLIIKLINDLNKNGIEETEVRLAKGYLKGSMDIKKEFCGTRSFYNGENEIYQMENPVPYNKKYDTFIEPVSKRRIDDAINKYFVRNGLVVSVVSNSSLNCKKMVRIVEAELLH